MSATTTCPICQRCSHCGGFGVVEEGTTKTVFAAAPLRVVTLVQVTICHSFEPQVDGLADERSIRETVVGEIVTFKIGDTDHPTTIQVVETLSATPPVVDGATFRATAPGVFKVHATSRTRDRSAIMSAFFELRAVPAELMEDRMVKFQRGIIGPATRPMRDRRLIVRSFVRSVPAAAIPTLTAERPAPLGTNWGVYGA